MDFDPILDGFDLFSSVSDLRTMVLTSDEWDFDPILDGFDLLSSVSDLRTMG